MRTRRLILTSKNTVYITVTNAYAKMSWNEVETARKEHRHELVLAGKEIAVRITESGLDPHLFDLVNLNYLDVHETGLETLPDEIGRLVNLQTLVLHSNGLTTLTDCLVQLHKLKMLDVSRNRLEMLPTMLDRLDQLATLNVSCNRLVLLPKLGRRLVVLDASHNRLVEFPDPLQTPSLVELRCSGNVIESIPSAVGSLVALKSFVMNSNRVRVIPGELADCTKLKELNLEENPVNDRRLAKLIVQGHAKQVLDYVRQHGQRAEPKQIKRVVKKTLEVIVPVIEPLAKISVRHCTDDTVKIVVRDDAKPVRAHLVACLVHNLVFTEDRFRKFIQLQTKLHDSVCDKRNAATIATHDAAKLGPGSLTYTALPPAELRVMPLNRHETFTGAQLFKTLQAEADALRKEKKRNVYTGIHKYLYLLEGKTKYPCLLNGVGEVVSFPPITNSDATKMTTNTTDLLVEVTGAGSQTVCKKVADALLREMALIFGDLVVRQVKNVDVEGNLKSVYPSRSDLQFEDVVVDRN